MVAKITFPEELMKALNYHEQKVLKGQATCLHAENFLRNAKDLNFHQKRERLQDLMDRHPTARIKLVHVSLNFHPSERLSQEKLIQIAKTYMDKIGFSEQPYLVYDHKDRDHQHIHILTTCIRADGTRISTHLLGANKSEPARKAIEEIFGLVQASKYDHALKSSVRNRVDAAIRSANTLAELVTELNRLQIGVTLYHNEQGFLYGISFTDHQKHAVFKGSKLGKKYTVAAILQRLNKSREITTTTLSEGQLPAKLPSSPTGNSSNQPLPIQVDSHALMDKLPNVSDGLEELLRAEEDHSGVPFELRRRKRKKKKRNNKL